MYLLYNSASELDMAIHPDKSRFLATKAYDRVPFHIGNVIISYRDSYCYLGSYISNNSVSNQIRDHIKASRTYL